MRCERTSPARPPRTLAPRTTSNKLEPDSIVIAPLAGCMQLAATIATCPGHYSIPSVLETENMASCWFAALWVTVTTLMLHADAHSYMLDPMPTWPVSWATNNFAATIAGNTYLPCPDGMSYSIAPELNTEAYWTAFNESTYTSLKDLVNKTGEVQTLSSFGTATIECGFSLANGTARDLPVEFVKWNQLTEGHDGPCEVWCDDVLAFEDDNCAVNYPDLPSQWPYDASKCEGASRLTAYWIALHGLPWQVYINCVLLTGSVNDTTVPAAASTSSSSTSTLTSTPTTTATSSPSISTAAPREAEDSECGSLDVAGSDESDCGSLDVAGSDECGSLDIAGDDIHESTSRSTSTSTSLATSTGTSTSGSSSSLTSTTNLSSVAGESDSDEVAGDAETASYIEDSECGSLDMAEDDSECGSLDIAEDSECGSLEMADSAGLEALYTGSSTGINFTTLQGATIVGTVSPQT
ncbi:unnamed protein product [Phytophthora fragariaefolia]|uniref:Unnamed protein product n=1 Tax=Phytophthora fragariaefolia TaxID=1490495 RepID=A0A9W6Y601_9STRA|nr:unnamed protein product [Phytophthora fragariaefolia]